MKAIDELKEKILERQYMVIDSIVFALRDAVLKDPSKFGQGDREKLSEAPPRSFSREPYEYSKLMLIAGLVRYPLEGDFAKLTRYGEDLYKKLEEEGYYNTIDKNLSIRAADIA